MLRTILYWLCMCVLGQLHSRVKLWPHGTVSTRLLCQWNFPGKNMEWVVISYSRGSSAFRDRNIISCMSCFGRWVLYHCATWEALDFVCCCCSVATLCNPMDQHIRLPCPSPSPAVCSNSYTLHQWCHPVILSSDTSSSAVNLSQHQGLFQWFSCSHQMTKVLELQLQH